MFKVYKVSAVFMVDIFGKFQSGRVCLVGLASQEKNT